MVISKKLYIFEESRRGEGGGVRGFNLFQGDGKPIELVVFQGVPDSLPPPPPLDSGIAYVHVPMCVAF